VDNFTPLSALIGGGLIGLSATILILVKGRIAGISGILGGALTIPLGDLGWRVLFLGGLVAGAALYNLLAPAPFVVEFDAGTPLLAVAGLLVGYGSSLGGGCTSGHGVCGIARLSPRSIGATVLFMAIAMATLFLMRHTGAA
jgi:uncharacterized protein